MYLKRKYLAEYETIARQAGEGMRAYVNRYHRAEKALSSIGIDICLTYDSESRGSRLLDRAKLNTEQQRMVLVGTAQSLNFEDIKNALVLQYPDHKPAPYLQGYVPPSAHRNSGRGHKGSGKKGFSKSGSSSSSYTSPTATSLASHRRTYVTEADA